MSTIPFQPNQRVCFKSGQNAEIRYGVIQWIGTLPPKNGRDHGTLAGLECDDAVGQANGMYQGIRYFKAKDGHAAFVPMNMLSHVKSEEKILSNEEIKNEFKPNGYDRANGEGVCDRDGRFLGAMGAPVLLRPNFGPRLNHPQPALPLAHQAAYMQRDQQPYPTTNLMTPDGHLNSNGGEVDEEEEQEQEEYFESDDDLDEILDVDFEEMERRLNDLLIKKNATLAQDAERDVDANRTVGSSAPAAVVVELDAAGVPIKESSDQWSKVAEKLKKAPTQVQEKLATDKALSIVSKKKEKAPVYNEELAKSNPKYKKSLCHFFESQGKCFHGDRCLFAHGEKELRLDVKPIKLYKKTILCQYHLAGGCRNGDHCSFAHGEHELITFRK